MPFCLPGTTDVPNGCVDPSQQPQENCTGYKSLCCHGNHIVNGGHGQIINHNVKNVLGVGKFIQRRFILLYSFLFLRNLRKTAPLTKVNKNCKEKYK